MEGIVAAIYLYPYRKSKVVEVASVEATVGEGLKGDQKRSERRQVTLISLEAWKKATAELGVELPPYTRRANILVSGFDLGSTIGKQVKVGEVILQINGETTPCQLMNEFKPGLQAALAPEVRAGVFGSILLGGNISAGDIVTVI
jgi:MOSC domain-containing protein YiiM